MRIKMIAPRAAVDGIDLSVFQPGHAYEVDASVATYLIFSGVAERCSDDAPALVVRTREVVTGMFAASGSRMCDVADDWEDDDNGPGAA